MPSGLAIRRSIHRSKAFRIAAGVCLVLSWVAHDLEAKDLAYLFDASGDISLVRDSVKSSISSSCIPLQHDDELVLGDSASARVVYPSAFFSLQGPRRYFVKGPSFVQVADSDGEREGVNPMENFRGAGGKDANDGQENLVFAPTELFSQVKPPIFRDKPLVQVLAPLGTTFSARPTITWKEVKGGQLEVSVKSLVDDESNSRFPWIRPKGSRIEWEATGWPTLKQGDLYLLRIRRDGKLLTGEEAGFWLVDDEDEYKALESDLAAIERTFPKSSTGRFLKANSLFKQGCFAEARQLADALASSEADNPVYLKFLQRCCSEMGFKDEVESLEKRIAKLLGNKEEGRDR